MTAVRVGRVRNAAARRHRAVSGPVLVALVQVVRGQIVRREIALVARGPAGIVDVVEIVRTAGARRNVAKNRARRGKPRRRN